MEGEKKIKQDNAQEEQGGGRKNQASQKTTAAG